MPSKIEEVGNRYGRLVVLEEAGRQNGKVLWKCRCDCGAITVVNGANLRGGITKSCSCLQKDTASALLTINEIGNVYGRLTVISKAGTHDYTAVWRCRCECGNIVDVLGPNLRFGLSKSCGCYERELARKRMKMFGLIETERKKKKPSMSAYVKRAERKGLTWDLPSYRFNDLIRQSCHYCGAEANEYNGIDRKDNDEGYIESNVVPCCQVCNFFKRDLSYDNFLSLIERIARHSLADRLMPVDQLKSGR